MISNSGHDENGKYKGGKAGDQTGTEWANINWYNRPWKCVLRHPNAKVRGKIAELSEKAARNNNIGYDQNERTTYWEQLKKVGYDPSKIKTPCEADCSAGVMANVKATGYILQIEELKKVTITSTYYMRNMLVNAGFDVLTASKYLTSANELLRGDILLNDGAHTAVNLTDGSKAGEKKQEPTGAFGGKAKVEPAKSFSHERNGCYAITASDYLSLRAGAGTQKTELAQMKKNETVICYGYYTDVSGTKWLLVVYKGITGFASSKYLKKK